MSKSSGLSPKFLSPDPKFTELEEKDQMIIINTLKGLL